MNAWERFQQFQPTWGGIVTVIVTLAIFLALRRHLPPDAQHRGRAPFFLLIVSLLLHTVAATVEVAGASRTAFGILNFLAVLSLTAAIIGTAAMAVFDVFLRRLHLHVPYLVRDVIQAVVLFIALLVILRRNGVNILSLVTTSAVLTAVIGLALQSTIANLFAGLTLQLDRTLALGDWIEVNGRIGRIAQINLRSTTLVTTDGDTAILPNGQLVGSVVLNYSRPNLAHRSALTVGFHYRHPPNQVRDVLLTAVQDTPGVLATPVPEIGPKDFADSAIVYLVRYWIDDLGREMSIACEVRTRIWYAAQRAGLELPFPIRNVFVTELTQDRATAEQEAEFLERMAALANIDLLEVLAPADREQLARSMRQTSFAAGELILRQGDPGDSLYFIHEGSVSVRLAVDGATREVAKLGAGKFFGEMSLVTGEPRTATCAATTDVVCYVIDHDAFQHLLESRPKLAEDISTTLARRQTALADEREGLSAEARTRQAAESSSALLARIRGFFHLG